jgi:ankyrin repeat protein
VSLFIIDGMLVRSTSHLLSSSIINKLSQKNPPFRIAYFFFDGRDSQNALQLHENLIRSLISQLSHQRGGIPTELADLYKRCGDHQQPSVNQLQDVLRNILDGFSHTYIVIDALDECADCKETLIWVKELVSGTNRPAENLHIIVTSRPEPDIKKVFEVLDPHSIDIVEATTKQDIIKYLKVQMNLKFEGCDESTREEIESALRERAEGSYVYPYIYSTIADNVPRFRWVALQIAELEKCSSTDEITKQLAELPNGLDDIYSRTLKKIDEKHRADTRTFLQWLAFSKRPMTVSEIAETITVDFTSEDGPVFISAKRYFNPQDVLVRCSSLVSESEGKYCQLNTAFKPLLTLKTGTIKLSHFSVKEYLLSDHIEKDFSISEKAAHVKISEISVAYLLQFDSFEPLTEAMLHSSPLAEYAAENWINHAKSGVMDAPSFLKLLLQLFTSGTGAFTNWIRIYNMDVSWQHQNLSMDKAEVYPPLYYASLAGLQQVAIHLLENLNQVDVNAQGGQYGNALQAASSGGHEVIVKLLLEKGADVNAQGGEYGNALQAASSGGHEVIVKLLLEKGADVNAQGGQYDNALQASSSGGHEVIVKLLLEKRANVNAQEGFYGNALQMASSGGHEVILKLLLEKGADVNAQGGFYGNALQMASSGGHVVIVKLLLEKGADVNAQGGFYGNALQMASSGGHEMIVKLLLEKGADVNAQAGEYGNALQIASSGGHEMIVKLLLEKGADVNAQGGQYVNALQAASAGGHEVIVKLLLEKGADVNAQGGQYSNALQAASARGHEVIVKLLLEKGADVNAQEEQYGNVLQVAFPGGHEMIVKLLLEKRADMNAQRGQYGNALQVASSGGHEVIVKLLLEKGADVNAQGGLYGNALQVASSGGHKVIVELLLQKGADVNAQEGFYGNALQAASSGGHEMIVKLLLERRADVNAQGGQYGNALQAASSGGHEMIVRLLLKKEADVNAQGGEYGNALQAASSGGHEMIVKLLLEKGADVKAEGGEYGNALQAASSGGHEMIVKLPLQKKADVIAHGGQYNNALQVASSGNYKMIVKLLLEKGADINSVAMENVSDPVIWKLLQGANQ